MSQPSMDIGSIAIVEDEPVVRRLMRLWLEADGYTVVEYGSGREALEHGVRGTAIVCLDLRLEDMPGQAVLAEIRARDPDIPIVVVTGDQDLETAGAAMRAGAYEYVTKPFDRARLGQAVGRAMAHRKLSERVRGLQRELSDQAARPSSPGGVEELSAADLALPPLDPLGGRPALTLLESEIPATLNLRELERAAITRALKLSGGSVGKAAKLLGIGRATLYRRLSEQRAPLGVEATTRMNGHDLIRS